MEGLLCLVQTPIPWIYKQTVLLALELASG